MTSSFDSTGITLDRVADIKSRLETLAKAQWGKSIDVSEDEFLGHQIANLSLILGEINELVQEIYDALSVSNSTGTQLDNLLELIGLYRSSDSYSTANLKLTATCATTVPTGTQYKTAAGIIFATDDELVFAAAGDDYVDATCTVVGQNNAAIGEISQIVNPINGITTVTNLAAAIPGSLRESDSEFKTMHTLAVATSGDDDVASLYEAIDSVEGVDAVYIHDNDTEEEASDYTPSHFIHVAVIGGDDDEIAAAIDDNKTAGVGTFGEEEIEVYNTTTCQTKTIYFDRAENVPIHIAIEGTAIVGVFPDNGSTLIREYLISHFSEFRINDDVIYTALYKPIYTCPGFIVTSLLIGTSDPPGGTSNIEITALERATLEVANIYIAVS
jgi:uncharacterized phage protein gp47/JayE